MRRIEVSSHFVTNRTEGREGRFKISVSEIDFFHSQQQRRALDQVSHLL